MANKAKEKKKNNKDLIISICIACIVIAAIIITTILMLKIKSNAPSEEFFVSDGTKYVINLKGEEYASEEEDYQAKEIHIVYYYSGETITGAKTYYEYSDEAKAKAAFNYYSEIFAGEYDNIELDGKYVVLTSNESDYKNKTTFDIEQQIKFIETQNDPTTNDAPVDEETIIEDSIVEEPAEPESPENTTAE